MPETLTIDARFCGPPRSGNGGYVCGRVAELLGGTVEVTLRAPPPLDKPLIVERGRDQTVALTDGDTLVASAQPSVLEVEPIEPPSRAATVTASESYAGFDAHVFPTCFVCGPDRGADALRIFAGPVAGRDLVAAPWTPAPDLGDEHGQVRAPFLWAALDCPSYFAVSAGKLSVLGRLTAEILRPVPVQTPCIVVAWPLEAVGRKRHAASAVFDDLGIPVALARAVWIEIDASKLAT